MHIYQMDSHGADGGALQCIWLVVTCETMMTRLYTVPHCSGSDAVIRIAKLTRLSAKQFLDSFTQERRFVSSVRDNLR